MIRLTIDNRAVEVAPGTTVLEAAKEAGIDIPTLCFLRGISQSVSCFVCAVEVEGRPRLLPSCAFPAQEGMVIRTDTENVIEARRTAIELLFSDHVGDCEAPCHMACPLALPTPEAIRFALNGQPDKAARLLRQASPLADILERICPRFCERACRRRMRDAPVNIRGLTSMLLEAHPEANGDLDFPESTGKRVAVVGAGPAGMTAASELAALGHSATLFDKSPEMGGLLRYGISEKRVPRELAQRAGRSIERAGVEFRPNTTLGVDLELGHLRSEFDAVILAIGASVIEDMEAEPGGQGPERTPDTELLRRLGLAADEAWANRKTLETCLPGVFATGEVVHGRGHAVRAAADGRLAAQSADAYLRGVEPSGHVRPFGVFMGKLSEKESAAFFAKASGDKRTDSDAALLPEQAKAEARRCFRCDCAAKHDCRLRDLGEAFGAKPRRFDGERREYERETTHADVVYEAGKCIACQRCIDVTRLHMEKYGMTFIGRGFHVKTAAPFNREMGEALLDAAAECVKACPTGALAFKRLGR